MRAVIDAALPVVVALAAVAGVGSIAAARNRRLDGGNDHADPK